MKKLIILFVITTIIFSCNNNRGWTARDRTKFINDCVGAAKTMGEDKARSYCTCMQPKVEAKYPTVAEANKISSTEFQSAEWTKEVKKCLGMDETNTNEGDPIDNTGTINDNTDNTNMVGWTASQRTQFINDCYGAAKDGMGEDKAKSYCECMQPKLEAKYSSFSEANKITQAELQSEEWLKEVKACLGY